MKFILLIFSVFFIYNVNAQTISLPNECKFKIGDDIEWANPNFNDADWSTKQLGKSWAATGIKENVYVWYRIKIFIPSNIKASVEKRNGLMLHLGKIDDVDQTFFNGKLIGQTGTFPPNYETKYAEQRNYIIAINEILWDKENVIVVRNFSPDYGGVGMYQGPYSVGPIQWTDFISVKHEIKGTDNGFSTKIKFTNNSKNKFNGKVKYWVADKDYKKLFSEIEKVNILPELKFEKEITFSKYQPTNETVLKVGYEIVEDSTAVNFKSEQVYLSNKKVIIKVDKEPKPVIENKIKDAFVSISFFQEQVNGYLGKRLQQNIEERLLKIDEAGIINGYLQRPGSHPWIGEHVGKYLETACNVWKNTHDERIKNQMDRLMLALINSQLNDGYLGTYIPAEYWTSWDVWSHKYNLYGLLAYYATTGYQPALEACKKMGDLLCKTFGNNSGQRDIILAGEHMGMAATSILDPMVELYRYTGDKKYLGFCYYILDAWEHANGPKIISALFTSGKVTKVGNGKAYEMLSNFVGLTKLYRLTGDEKLLKPVLIAWQDIVTNRLYITGTTSSMEYFQDDDVLPAADKDHIGEGCVTTTWIQLNQNLLNITGDVKYLEEIEKSIYNHLLAAENPQTGCVSYYTPLMDKKPYSCEITCCTSSVPRGIAMIPFFTVGKLNESAIIMLYENGKYKENIISNGDKKIQLELDISTDFPSSGEVEIVVKPNLTADFPILLRTPSWSKHFIATVNGEKYENNIQGYLTINRLWKLGDKISISFDMPIQFIDGGKSYPDQIAFKRGPQVLAFDSDLNNKILPKQWIGKQVYDAELKNNQKQKFVLVPFADAGQTGAAVKVWLPLNEVLK